MLGVAACIDVMPLRLQDRVVQQEPREYVQGFAASARDHLVVKGAHLVRGVGIDRDRLIVVAESELCRTAKRCPSEEERCPVPQADASGRRW